MDLDTTDAGRKLAIGTLRCELKTDTESFQLVFERRVKRKRDRVTAYSIVYGQLFTVNMETGEVKQKRGAHPVALKAAQAVLLYATGKRPLRETTQLIVDDEGSEYRQRERERREVEKEELLAQAAEYERFNGESINYCRTGAGELATMIDACMAEAVPLWEVNDRIDRDPLATVSQKIDARNLASMLDVIRQTRWHAEFGF